MPICPSPLRSPAGQPVAGALSTAMFTMVTMSLMLTSPEWSQSPPHDFGVGEALAVVVGVALAVAVVVAVAVGV